MRSTSSRMPADFRRFPEAPRGDAYIFDVKLPDESGIDLLRWLQQLEVPRRSS